jgi:hypothetical protein
MVFHEVYLPDFRICLGSFRGKCLTHPTSTSSLTGNRRERRLERESIECLRKNARGGISCSTMLQSAGGNGEFMYRRSGTGGQINCRGCGKGHRGQKGLRVSDYKNGNPSTDQLQSSVYFQLTRTTSTASAKCHERINNFHPRLRLLDDAIKKRRERKRRVQSDTSHSCSTVPGLCAKADTVVCMYRKVWQLRSGMLP